MQKMRSARKAASRRSWVTRMTVTPRAACRSRITHQSSSRVKASSAAEGLVEHQELRLVDERAAERGALLHAAGELPGILVALALEPDLGEQRLGPGDVLGPVAAQARAVGLDDLQGQQQVLERRAPGQQRRVLEGHPGELDGAPTSLAVDDHRAGARKLQAGGELHQGGLAAARRPDDRRELAFADRERRARSTAGAPSSAPGIDMGDVAELDEGGQGQAPRRLPPPRASGRCRDRRAARCAAAPGKEEGQFTSPCARPPAAGSDP